MSQNSGADGDYQGVIPTQTGTTDGDGRKRLLRNFLLQPLLQVRLGLYSIFLSAAFSGSVLAILYWKLNEVYDVILELTDVRNEVSDILNSYLVETVSWVILVIFTFLVLNIVMSIIYTHRLIGPTYAFRRHIRFLAQGNFRVRTHLRKKDAFAEVAQDLNRLSQVLEQKLGSGTERK